MKVANTSIAGYSNVVFIFKLIQRNGTALILVILFYRSQSLSRVSFMPMSYNEGMLFLFD